jgi:hypothetical protein
MMELSKVTEDEPIDFSKRNEVPEEKKASQDVNELDIGEIQAPILYSNKSIFFMILFSGLAIGSDAYNSALMGQLLLLFTELYPDTLSTATQAQLTNAFIIGLVSFLMAPFCYSSFR